jgi:hypothetical protein
MGPVVSVTAAARPAAAPPEQRVPAWALAVGSAVAALVVRILAGRRAPRD